MTDNERNHNSSGNTTSPRNEVQMTNSDFSENEIEHLDENLKTFKIRARNVIMTINEKSMKFIDEIVKYVKKKGATYILVCQHDQPQNHLHLYAQFIDVRVIDSKFLHGSHVEKCFGSAQQNIKYCKGEDEKHQKLGIECRTIYEDGEPKMRGGLNIKAIKEMTEDEIDELPPNLYNIAMKIKEQENEKKAVDDWLKDQIIDVEWHVGLAKTGKTSYAKMIGRRYREQGKKVLVVSFDKNGFTHTVGSKECELLIINEFRWEKYSFTDFLEILSNEHQYNLKNGSCFLQKLEKIIITSQQQPIELYPALLEDRNQIYRRIENVYIHKRNGKKYEMEMYMIDCCGQLTWLKTYDITDEKRFVQTV